MRFLVASTRHVFTPASIVNLELAGWERLGTFFRSPHFECLVEAQDAFMDAMPDDVPAHLVGCKCCDYGFVWLATL